MTSSCSHPKTIEDVKQNVNAFPFAWNICLCEDF
jgi:hypothetical protein